MALFGKLSTLRAQLVRPEHFQPAFAYLEDAMLADSAPRKRLQAMEAGKSERVELAGGAFAIEQVYLSKPRSEGLFESHRAYIDVQFIVEGEELIEVIEVPDLQLKEDLTPGKDLLFYRVPEARAVLRVGSGEGAVLFPIDGHMPSIAVASPALVRKIVVKVPVFA